MKTNIAAGIYNGTKWIVIWQKKKKNDLAMTKGWGMHSILFINSNNNQQFQGSYLLILQLKDFLIVLIRKPNKMQKIREGVEGTMEYEYWMNRDNEQYRIVLTHANRWKNMLMFVEANKQQQKNT